MASRIEVGYRERFRGLLQQLAVAEPDREAEQLLGRARERAAEQGLSLDEALARAYEDLRERVRRTAPPPALGTTPRFLCDESLGGLARWLHAAGHDARGLRGVKSDALLRAALEESRILVTTDGHLLERRLVKEGRVRMVWVPSRMPLNRQLGLVMADLGLAFLAPRCMSCGAELAPVAKEAVRERIPPKTALWKDEYFLCRGCGRLLWQGTHWERIESRLAQIGPPRLESPAKNE